MRPEIQAPTRRIRWSLAALAAGVLACSLLAGCSKGPTLDAIRQQQKDGDYAGTVEPLREFLARNPDDGEANFLYGRALAFTQPNLAPWSLRKAMEDPDWFVPAATQLALVALTAEDYKEAIDVTTRILERDPKNVRALTMRGNAYAHSRQNPEKAIADAKRILEIDPNYTEAYEPLILGLIGLKRFDDVRDALAAAGRQLQERGDPKLLAWHCATTAVFHQEVGETDEARKTWDQCLEKYPANLDVVSNAMTFHDQQGESARSLEIVRAAYAHAPDSRPIRMALAQRLAASGKVEEALALLRKATSTDDPRRAAAAWKDLGRFQDDAGDYAAAADALGRAIELEKSGGSGKAGSPSPQDLYDYAGTLVRAGRLDRAREVADQLTLPAYHHEILARVLQEERRPAEALAEFDESLKVWPDNVQGRYQAARAAEELGDFGRALEEYRNAVRIHPGATDARTRGAALLLAEGNIDGAFLMLETETDTTPLDVSGLLLAMRLSGRLGAGKKVADYLEVLRSRFPAFVGRGLAEAAEGLSERKVAGQSLAVQMLVQAPVDFGNPRNAEALRALVQHGHDAGVLDSLRPQLEKVLSAHPDAPAFAEIQGLYLELSAADPAKVTAAYEHALKLDPKSTRALLGLGRMAQRKKDPEAAIRYFEQAVAADPSDPDPQLALGKALAGQKRYAEAAKQLDALLLAQPCDNDAAYERALVDVEQGVATDETLERAQRAVRFGGGADALELLSRVYALRNQPEEAAKVAKEAESARAKGQAGAGPASPENASAGPEATPKTPKQTQDPKKTPKEKG